MIDNAKRNTVKKIGVVIGGAATAVLSSGASNAAVAIGGSGTAQAVPMIFASVRAASDGAHGHVEVELFNNGIEALAIDHITPAESWSDAGRFDFGYLTRGASLTLQPGSSITVPVVDRQELHRTTMKAAVESVAQALRSALHVADRAGDYHRVPVVSDVSLA